jgi:hypothetical protein
MLSHIPPGSFCAGKSAIDESTSGTVVGELRSAQLRTSTDAD